MGWEKGLLILARICLLNIPGMISKRNWSAPIARPTPTVSETDCESMKNSHSELIVFCSRKKLAKKTKLKRAPGLRE